MIQPISCDKCEDPITDLGYKCITCSTDEAESFYCQRCFHAKHENLQHTVKLIEHAEISNTQLINSIIEFEQLHLPKTNEPPKLFPSKDQDSNVWKRSDFLKISYHLPNEMPFKDSIPFVCDYLRMNNSLRNLADKLNLKLCSTDIIILILKYSSFNIRLFVMEQLCIFHRAIPIYFGVPSHENSSIKYYFLMQEMLQMFLPYSYQKIPLILSFGTPLCKEKTLVLNKILQTNFDCHSKSESNFEKASPYYHKELIQMVLGHWYNADRDRHNKVIHNYYCHILDLHGSYDWNQMPHFFIEFASVIIIHMDVADSYQIDTFAWLSVTFHPTATYLIFVHGTISDSDMKTKFESKIREYFDTNKRNVHFFRTNVVLNGNDKTLQGVLPLLKQAPLPTKSLLDISEQLVQQHNINLSTDRNILLQTKQLLDDFHTVRDALLRDDPSLQLFPLSRLKQLSDKTVLLSDEKVQKDQLMKSLYEHSFNHAHVLLTKLAELAIAEDNNTFPFEKAVLLWNIIFWQQKQDAVQRSPISSLDQLEMNKEHFLREFQERCMPYKDRNDIYHSFGDKAQIEKALVNIYQRSFRNQERIELINATSDSTYSKIFDESFRNNPDDSEKFFVIGIIGEQSQGKSFLINKAFGTKSAESFLKCTTGILATRINITGHETVKNIITLDTEGLLDASKKNAAQIFDRKMVFTVMARSHIVMINIRGNVNIIMQQILEIVFYGFKKLNITNKPKLIFLFRDQEDSTMQGDGHRNQVESVIKNIKQNFEDVHIIQKNISDDFDIHEFSSPFPGERKIAFFNDSFCQQALSLRRKVIDHLASLTPFGSFNEWVDLTLQCWEKISFNSNLFDFESLVHLTLEKDLEVFCNEKLTDVDSKMGQYIESELKNKTINTLSDTIDVNKIRIELARIRIDAEKDILNKLEAKKCRLMADYKLGSFKEALLEKTKARINSSLDLYEVFHHATANKYLTQDEFQRQLLSTVKELSDKTRNITDVSEDEIQFEMSFNNTSTALLESFVNWLNNDYKKQSISNKEKLLGQFINQNKIDKIGVQILPKDMENPSLKKIIREVLGENSQSEEKLYRNTTHQSMISIDQQGYGMLRNPAIFIDQQFTYEKKHNEGKVQLLEQMLLFIQREYRSLKNTYYDTHNLLPASELCNLCVKNINENIQTCKVTNQDTINIWYTCYVVMLTIFCDKHYEYVQNKLVTNFKEEISRTKIEVKQNVVDISKAKEHGQLLTESIWKIIQKKIQEQVREEFERSINGWNDYRPSVISENCVNQLFQSNKYQEMFNYIQNPSTYIKDWLRSKFDEKYQSQLSHKIFNFSSNLEENKTKFSRMLLNWLTAVQLPNLSGLTLIDSLKKFLFCGKYTENNIVLSESTGGFHFHEIDEITIGIPISDKLSFLNSISSTSKSLLADNNDTVVQSTREWINNDEQKNRLFDQFYDKAKGCGIPCPYCKQICDNDDPHHNEHRTEYHLLWIFAGYRYETTEKPGLTCCTSHEAFTQQIKSLTDKDTFMIFKEHMQRFNPSWKITNLMTPLSDFQLKAYIALEEDLAKHYKFKGRADMTIRKRFLRSTVTVHCYALLVGIDYENTPNNLHGIPSYGVTSIKDQLHVSCIAHPENLHVLGNNEATKENILNNFDTLINNMDERSTFIFYFSGRGSRTTTSISYLMTSDNKQLTAGELALIFSNAKTKNIIMILNSCYSGDRSNAFQFDSNPNPQGSHILCASHEDQLAYQLDSDRNGFFTKYLIKGLKGQFSCEVNNCKECDTRTKNFQQAPIQKITSTELATYLTHAVSRHQQITHTAINGSTFDISFLD